MGESMVSSTAAEAKPSEVGKLKLEEVQRRLGGINPRKWGLGSGSCAFQ